MIQNSLLRSLQILIYLFPLSFIFGNLIINFFILFISVIGILLYRKKIFIWKDKLIINLIFSFFLLILISSYFNYFFYKENADAFKSILFLRSSLWISTLLNRLRIYQISLVHGLEKIWLYQNKEVLELGKKKLK